MFRAKQHRVQRFSVPITFGEVGFEVADGELIQALLGLWGHWRFWLALWLLERTGRDTNQHPCQVKDIHSGGLKRGSGWNPHLRLILEGLEQPCLQRRQVPGACVLHGFLLRLIQLQTGETREMCMFRRIRNKMDREKWKLLSV